jgi:invasion protein IalB
MKKFFLTFIIILLATTPVLAQKQTSKQTPAPPEKLGTFGNWSAFRFHENGQPVCFLKGKPQQAGKLKGRKQTFIMITHRPAENSLNVVHVMAGFDYQLGSDVRMTIDGKNYNLFTAGNEAWGRDSVTDRNLVKAMRDGKGNLSVRGTNRSGRAVTDSYSLRGITAGWQKINQACNMSVL